MYPPYYPDDVSIPLALCLPPNEELKQSCSGWQVFKVLCLLLCNLGRIVSVAHAQVTPDGSLSTSVTSLDGQTFVIESGNRSGTNLFHSFDEFSIPTNGSAVFANALDIANIFSRVTGSTVSKIDGLIQTNGAANLFLLNPNGILFGPNARLDIGGSFLGSTADTLLFDDGIAFSTTNSEASPLLSVSVPVGLQLTQATPKPITLQNATLEVPIGANLTLLGGDLALSESTLQTAGGQLILGSLGTAGTVQLGANQSFQFPEGVARGDVTLGDASFVSAEAGRLDVFTDTLSLSGESRLQTVTNSSSAAGNITVNAAGAIDITESEISSVTRGPGDAGDLLIEAGQLSLMGGDILVQTFATGNAGNIHIRARESIELDTALEGENRSVISNGVNQEASGIGGEIELETSVLRVLNGSNIIAASIGTGEVGNITVNASESVELVGGRSNEVPIFIPSSILVFNSANNTAARGNLTITTGQLRVLDGAAMVVSSLGEDGDSGTLTITARDSIDITGQGPTRGSALSTLSQSSNSGTGGDLILRTEQLRIADGGNLLALASEAGNGGNIIIDTRTISLSNRGNILASASGIGNAGGVDITATQNVSVVGSRSEITVSAESGNAGELAIMANSLLLDRGGRLNASVDGGEEGNIRLTLNETLVLRRGSSITTEATGASAGGNIDIMAPFVVSRPTENSDIVADAQQGDGGNIQIRATGIFGLEFRPQRTPLSDITASSQFGADGLVQIEALEVDPNQEGVELPNTLTDHSDQIVTGCLVAADNSFVVTGRQGLPTDPSLLSSSTTWEDWRPLEAELEAKPRASVTAVPVVGFPAPLVEAIGIVMNANGQVQLVAPTDAVSNISLRADGAGCLTFRSGLKDV
ncbi:MAG: S-layer family protein [Cyanobacteria bacterium P01_H01_bin.105]